MLDKAIKHKKEYREEYRKSKRFDKSCRNHGGCPHCEGNRLKNYKQRKEVADEEIKEHLKE